MWKEAILTFMAFSQYMPSVSYAIFLCKTILQFETIRIIYLKFYRSYDVVKYPEINKPLYCDNTISLFFL